MNRWGTPVRTIQQPVTCIININRSASILSLRLQQTLYVYFLLILMRIDVRVRLEFVP
jgi:hypothetical protein